MSGGKIATDTKGGGIGRSVGGFIDPKLSWDDIAWLRKHTHLPIGLKGVQTVEDVVKAAELGVDAIYLSNHGWVLLIYLGTTLISGVGLWIQHRRLYTLSLKCIKCARR